MLMKKYLFLTLLLTLLSLTGAQAQTEYALKIYGTTVTSANAADILGDGAFSYNAATKTLTLAGDCTREKTGSVSLLIENTGIDGLVINVSKDVTLTFNSWILDLSANTTISGSGKLTMINTTLANGVYVNGCKLTLDNVDVECEGEFYGNSASLLVRKSNLHVTATDGAIYSFGYGIKLEECYIRVPAGGRNDVMRIVDSQGNTAKEVVIEKSMVYDLYVCGTRVSGSNISDILGNGVFSYDVEENTLNIKGSMDYTGDDYIINNKEKGLTINVTADALLTSANESVIFIDEDTKITGKAKLQLQSEYCAIVVETADLLIEDAHIEAAGRWGIGGSSTGENLGIDNSSLRIVSSVGAITDFLDVELMNCSITSPQGGKALGGNIVDADGNVADDVEIVADDELEDYGLRILGERVTNANYTNILGDIFDSGTFVYDPDTKTLHVKGLAVDPELLEDKTMIVNKDVDGLTISIDDDALVSAFNGIEVYKNTTITGDGLLLMQSIGPLIAAHKGAKLTLQDLSLGFKTVMGGIFGDEEGASIELNNVWLQGQTFYLVSPGVVCAFNGGITMTGCHIETPDDAEVVDGWIVSDSVNSLFELTIVRDDANAIDAINAQKFADMPRFNLHGMRVGSDYKGLVISGGKKMLSR